MAARLRCVVRVEGRLPSVGLSENQRVGLDRSVSTLTGVAVGMPASQRAVVVIRRAGVRGVHVSDEEVHELVYGVDYEESDAEYKLKEKST